MSDIWDVNDQGQFVSRKTGDVVEPTGDAPIASDVMPQELIDQHYAREYPPDPSIPSVRPDPITPTTP